MAIKIYNTLTKKKEELRPRDSGKISMYVCGLTVYNYMHIGNARTFISFDMIRRYLERRGFEVTFVRNITDVDDKIINRAAEEGVTAAEVARKYEDAFKADTAMLGLKDPDIEPKATETIPEMIALIEKLAAAGLAYEVGGNVWYRVRAFDGYGKLSGRSLDDMRAGERVTPEPGKDDPMDFALWKRAKEGEPAWESPWGLGRPGWHIECSAMSLKYLGSDFDIHGGAVDLVFPHHENEIAQSEGGGDLFARVWMHGGLLNIDKEKMSKSLGNVMLVGDLLKQWSPAVVRMFMLGTHYRNPLDFTREGLVQAQANVERIERTLQNLDYALSLTDKPISRVNTLAMYEGIDEAKAHFISVMDDDFNTAEGLSAIFKFVKKINTLIEGAQEETPVAETLHRSRETLLELTEALGLDLEPEIDWMAIEAPLRDLAAEVIGILPGSVSRDGVLTALLEYRGRARADQDWKTADLIRDRLTAMGIEIEDTAAGSRWKLIKA